MQRNTPTHSHLLLVFLASVIPRIVGAIWLPNAFGDAYAYTEQIYYLRRALLNGSFAVSSLFGFWLPLYQLICGGVSAIVGSPFYVPKIISALCGGGICLVVFVLTRQLTSSVFWSYVTAAVVAINPYHVIYSSSALTDIPHAFLILLCVYCCIKERWLLSAIFALGAGLMRIESWTLIPIIPLAHFVSRSKFNVVGRSTSLRLATSTLLALCLSVGPLFWLYVSWKATGSFTRYFEIRNNYIVETLATNPWLASLSPARIGLDFLRLIYTANPVVLAAVVVLLLVNSNGNKDLSHFAALLLRCRDSLQSPEGLLLIFFCSHLGFLLLAYCTNNQPEIWPRYGLIFFTLGLPLLARALVGITGWSTGTARFSRASLYAAASLFALQFCVQLIDVTRLVVKSDPNVVAAEFIETQKHADPTVKVYCEDGAIRVLSGIPLEEFRDQYNSPSDQKAFFESLKANQVRFLIYKDLPGSHLRDIIAQIRSGKAGNGISLEEIVPRARKSKQDVIVYRVHEGEVASGQGLGIGRRRYSARQSAQP